jgi:glutamate-1-semialdehyde 2,1-aminomutase
MLTGHFQQERPDATTLCLTIARAKTGRQVVPIAKGAYHGSVGWCNSNATGVPAEERALVSHYLYNDLESVERAVATAGPENIAAIFVSHFATTRGLIKSCSQGDYVP